MVYKLYMNENSKEVYAGNISDPTTKKQKPL